MDFRPVQAWVLRLVGTVELFAFVAVVMPHAWMEAGHLWLGLGALPTAPVFGVVMREVSFTYGLHGVAMWLIASDVTRYRPLIALAAAGYLLAGPAFVAIDVAAGMPGAWVVANGGSCLLIGATLAGLLVGAARQGPGTRD